MCQFSPDNLKMSKQDLAITLKVVNGKKLEAGENPIEKLGKIEIPDRANHPLAVTYVSTIIPYQLYKYKKA
jgi:hypothetical protein